MSNPWAGEVEAKIDGTVFNLKLTLGSLAALEAELESVTLVEIVERMEAGRFSSQDILAIIRAGLRGGGNKLSDIDLMTAQFDGGPLEASRVAAKLITTAFTGHEANVNC